MQILYVVSSTWPYYIFLWPYFPIANVQLTDHCLCKRKIFIKPLQWLNVASWNINNWLEKEVRDFNDKTNPKYIGDFNWWKIFFLQYVAIFQTLYIELWSRWPLITNGDHLNTNIKRRKFKVSGKEAMKFFFFPSYICNLRNFSFRKICLRNMFLVKALVISFLFWN